MSRAWPGSGTSWVRYPLCIPATKNPAKPMAMRFSRPSGRDRRRAEVRALRPVEPALQADEGRQREQQRDPELDHAVREHRGDGAPPGPPVPDERPNEPALAPAQAAGDR